MKLFSLIRQALAPSASQSCLNPLANVNAKAVAVSFDVRPSVKFQCKNPADQRSAESLLSGSRNWDIIPKRVSRQLIKTNNTSLTPKANLGAMLMSLLLGVVALMGARYIRFQLAAIPDAGTDPATLMAMDAGLAAILVFFVGGMLKHKTLRHMGSQVVGIALMAVTMHNLVWLFPAEFAQVYSQDYVEQVTAATVPLSLYVNGATVISL